MTVSKVIELAAYKKAIKQPVDECGMLELEDTANTLCEEAWHLLIPMRSLGIHALTIDSTGSILNIQYRDDDSDEPLRH